MQIMARDIVVRQAKKTDLKKVGILFSQILHELPYYSPLAKGCESKKYTLAKLAEKRSQDPYSILVAVDESDKVLGFCFNHFDDFTIWVDWFGVERHTRRRGIGKTLLNCLFELSEKRGAHKVWCDTRSSNEPSKNLLREMEFNEIVEIKNHWYKQDFILWERFL